MIAVLTFAVTPISAVTYTSIGVAPGSSSVYSEKFSASVSTTENKMVISIASLFAPLVTQNITYYLSNGLISRHQSITVDVSGTSNYFAMEGIIAANLTADDPIYPTAPYKINDTSTMTVAGASRTINHFKQGGPFNPTTDYWLEDWWDKATGITVKFNLWFPGSPGAWQNVTMVSTTAWLPSATESAFSSTSLITIGVVGIVALVIGYLAGGHGKRKK